MQEAHQLGHLLDRPGVDQEIMITALIFTLVIIIVIELLLGQTTLNRVIICCYIQEVTL